MSAARVDTLTLILCLVIEVEKMQLAPIVQYLRGG